MALNCPADGLTDGIHYELHMSDAAGTVFTKVLHIQTIGAVGGGSYATDDVSTLDDAVTVNVPAGPLNQDAIEISGLRIFGNAQQEDLHALFRAKACRRWKIIAPDAKHTTHEFCGSITAWKPVTDRTKKDRLNFTLTPAGDYTITDADGQIYPADPAP